MRAPTLLALTVAVTACRGRPRQVAVPVPAPSRTSVLLLTIDTLRPDALGWVAGRNATPALDRLAAQGVRFPAAVAPVPLTFPSHAALMTGVLPRRLGLRDNGQSLGAQPVTLAERLRGLGYATAAFVSGYPLAKAFGLDRGFESYDDRMTAAPEGEDERVERPAADTTAAALAWLRGARRPFFLWVHFYEPHYPYTPPEELRRPGPRGAYDGEVALADRWAGELLRAVESAAGPELLTVLAGDHGESLGEHGEGTHGFFVYDATVLVPLVVRGPGLAPRESREPVRLVDLAPTVLDLLGQSPLSGTDGGSFKAALTGGAFQAAPAYVETYQPWLSYGWAPLSALRDRGWKLVMAPRPELYDLSGDPGESRDLFEANRQKAAGLERLRRPIAELPRVSAPGGEADAEAVARLRALGYLGGGSSGEAEPPAAGLRDPKDGREVHDLLTAADLKLRARDARGAAAGFEAALAKDPGNRFALQRGGAALLAAGDPARAAERLRAAVRANPGQPEARSALARALLQLGRPAEAVKALQQAAALAPDDARLLTRLAFAEHAAGRIADAARDLARAASLDEARFAHAGALGILLADLGRQEEARAWLEKSRPAEADYQEARRRLARLVTRNRVAR